jgi:hypothetical protein
MKPTISPIVAIPPPAATSHVVIVLIGELTGLAVPAPPAAARVIE